MSPLVSALTLSLYLLISSVTAIRLGEWEDLSKTGSLSDLSSRVWAFDRSVNLGYCARAEIVVPLDGRADYTKIFNDALKRLGRQGGGTLKLGAGVYPHSRQIVMPSYTCIVGSGMERTFIRLIANAPKFRLSGSIRSMHTERITLINFTQDGNRGEQSNSKTQNYGRYGFFSELTNYVYLKNVRVRNNYGYGFDPHGSKKYWSYYLVIEGCEAINNGLDGFTIDQTVHATIINGFAKNNVRHGYNVVTGTQLAVFRTCTALTNGKDSGVGFGFVAQNNHNFGTNSLAFELCMATNNFRGAFKLRDVYSVTVADSKMTGNGDSVCYELSQTRSVFLQRNLCAGVRASRKFKLGAAATYSESGDRSSIASTRSVPATAPKPVIDNKPDPTCTRGRATSNVCCSAACKKCGGLGCGMKTTGPGASSCCITPVRLSKRSCKVLGPPCVI